MICRLLIALLAISVVLAEKDYTPVVKLLKEKIEDKNGPFYHSAY